MSADTENDARASDGALATTSLLMTAVVGAGAWSVAILSRLRYCGENNQYGPGGVVWDACNRFGDLGLFVPMFVPTALVVVAGAVALRNSQGPVQPG